MGGQCFSQRFLGGCSTRLPPCRHRTHGSEHPYCFCGSEVRCSLPSSCPLETYVLPASVPWITSLQKQLSFSERSLPILPLQSLLLMALLCLTSSLCSLTLRLLIFFCQTLLLLALPLPQSVSSRTSPIQCLRFFFIPASSQSSRHPSSHADHLVMGGGSGSEPS